MGTGCLGWPPETVLHTPIPQIELALKGKADYTRAVNGVPDPDELPETKPPEDVASGLAGFLRARK